VKQWLRRSEEVREINRKEIWRSYKGRKKIKENIIKGKKNKDVNIKA
jgi:hypothetical protein